MAYSLIAPLFPPLFKERDISNIICSYLIAIICVTNIIAAIYCSYLSEKFGQKNLFLFCVVGQTLSTFFYGFSVYIYNIPLFLIIGLLIVYFMGFVQELLMLQVFL